MHLTRLDHRFVDQVPEHPEQGTLYVSLPFRTTLHLCACGCGNEVWVPIRPDRHHVIYDGETITLQGSIGNWRFPCRSHYWIRAGRIVWDHETQRRSQWRGRLVGALRKLGVRR